jgi:hypothetical protein
VKHTIELDDKQIAVLRHVLGDAVSDWGEPFKDFDPQYNYKGMRDFDPYPIAEKLDKELGKLLPYKHATGNK